MPYSQDPDAYPESFPKLFLRALSEDFEIELSDKNEAINLRHQLHAYRRASERAMLPGWSNLRKIQIQLSGSTIKFHNNLKLLSALNEAAKIKPPSEDQIEAYLKQLPEDES